MSRRLRSGRAAAIPEKEKKRPASFITTRAVSASGYDSDAQGVLALKPVSTFFLVLVRSNCASQHAPSLA